jgi:hypothetical protein
MQSAGRVDMAAMTRGLQTVRAGGSAPVPLGWLVKLS